MYANKRSSLTDSFVCRIAPFYFYPVYVLFFYSRAFQQCAVRQETLECQLIFCSFHSHIIICFRLGRYIFIQTVLFPEAGILDVASYAGNDVERSRRIALEIPDVSPVTVGVQVGGKDDVYARFIKEGHPECAFLGKSFFPWLGPAGIRIAVDPCA